MRSAYVCSLDTGEHHQVTDGMSDVGSPVFDRGGKYLYLISSTDVGPQMDTSMMSFNKAVTSSVYLVVLKKDLPSPLAPESDEEKDGSQGGGESKKSDPVSVKIDLEKISQRILALPLPARNYEELIPGKEGGMFVVERPSMPFGLGPGGMTVQKFDLKTPKTDQLIAGGSFFTVSDNDEKMLYRQGPQ